MSQKTLWHSEAVGLGQIEVTVKSESKNSKYQGKPNYVDLVIGGNPRQYQVENPSCGDFFKGKVGQNILIEFRDSRENASIHLMGPNRGQASAPQQQQRTDTRPQQSPTTNQPPADTRQAPPVNNPPPNNPAPPKKTADEVAAEHLAAMKDSVLSAMKFANKKINTFEIAMRAVDHLAERRAKAGRAITPEQFQGIVTSIFISMDRAGLSDTLPTGDLDKYLPEPKAKQ